MEKGDITYIPEQQPWRWILSVLNPLIYYSNHVQVCRCHLQIKTKDSVTVQIKENQKSSIWQLYHHPWHCKLSLRQLTVPPVTTKLRNWWPFVLSHSFIISNLLLLSARLTDICRYTDRQIWSLAPGVGEDIAFVNLQIFLIYLESLKLIVPSHKSHNAPDKNPTMHHFVI